MSVKKVNYYGFKHEAVNKLHGSKLVFINYMSFTDIYGNQIVAAVYKDKYPDKEKKHKKYLIYAKHKDGKFYRLGRSTKELKDFRYVSAVKCHECKTIMYSVDRHDFNQCDCENQTFIDGGTDYTRIGAKDLTKTEVVTLDLLTDKIVVKD